MKSHLRFTGFGSVIIAIFVTFLFAGCEKTDTVASSADVNSTVENVGSRKVSPAKDSKDKLTLPVGLARLHLKFVTKKALLRGVQEWTQELQMAGSGAISVQFDGGDVFGAWLNFNPLLKQGSALTHTDQLTLLDGATPVGERLMYWEPPMELVQITLLYG